MAGWLGDGRRGGGGMIDVTGERHKGLATSELQRPHDAINLAMQATNVLEF